MDNKHESFEEAVINKGFAVVAKSLSISQSTISKRIVSQSNIHSKIVSVKSAESMNRIMFYREFLKNASLIIIFLFFLSLHGKTQDNDNHDIPDTLSPTNYYTQLSISFTSPIYRDFATSPLFYRGVGLYGSSAWLKESDLRERVFKMDMGFNTMSAVFPQSDLINFSGSATLVNLNLYYQQLWKLKSLSSLKNNVKVGGVVVTSQNFRLNNSLYNNALGLENISNVMASAQLTRNISRTEPKQLNLLIFKPILKPVKRDLRFQFNVGILNFNYRPGYAYSYDDELIGTETNPFSWALSNYKWSMNGWRLNTQIEYIEYLANGNARSLSYIWAAAHAPGKFEAFQMASHRIQYTLYFNRKKR